MLLEFIVVIGPTLFAVGLEMVSEDIRRNKYWKWGVMAFGVLLSVLTFWQIVRQERLAATDRQKAVQETAAETSRLVTAAVTDKFKETVSGLQSENATLQTKLESQGRDLATIKSSNIVTGAKPIPVEVTNGEVPQRAAETEAEKKKRQQIRTALGSLQVEANQIINQCGADPPIKDFDCEHAGNEWYGRAMAYIQKNLELSYAARFQTSAAPAGFGYANVSSNNNKVMVGLNGKSRALEEFIKELL